MKIRAAVSRRTVTELAGSSPAKKVISLEWVLEQVEHRMILRAMKQANANRADLAERLGMARATLLRRLKALGLDKE